MGRSTKRKKALSDSESPTPTDPRNDKPSLERQTLALSLTNQMHHGAGNLAAFPDFIARP